MKRYILAILLFIHIALVFMLLGAGILDTYVNFPDWFQNIPDSLMVTRQFFAFRNPGFFFVPALLLVLVSGATFVAAGWKHEPARIWVLVGTAFFFTVLLLNLGFIYPRIGALIGAGLDTSTVEELQKTAQEMQVLLQVRMVLVLIGTAFDVFGLWRFYENAPKRTFNDDAAEILSGKSE
jgi:hypothetical protein